MHADEIDRTTRTRSQEPLQPRQPVRIGHTRSPKLRTAGEGVHPLAIGGGGDGGGDIAFQGWSGSEKERRWGNEPSQRAVREAVAEAIQVLVSLAVAV